MGERQRDGKNMLRIKTKGLPGVAVSDASI